MEVFSWDLIYKVGSFASILSLLIALSAQARISQLKKRLATHKRLTEMISNISFLDEDFRSLFERGKHIDETLSKAIERTRIVAREAVLMDNTQIKRIGRKALRSFQIWLGLGEFFRWVGMTSAGDHCNRRIHRAWFRLRIELDAERSRME
jgi:hypothetical protein